MLNRMTTALLLGVILGVPSAWAELPFAETRQEIPRCNSSNDCTPLGISAANGVVILWVTFDDSPKQLYALGSDGSSVVFGNTLVNFLDASGSFAVATFEELPRAVMIDVNNPGEFFTAASPDFPDQIATVFGVNSSGAFAGSFGGAAANAFVPGAAGAIFLPGVETNAGLAFDISENADLVCGVTSIRSGELRPTLWKVDGNLSVLSSGFIGEEVVGNPLIDGCRQVENTNLDPEGVAVVKINGVDSAYFISTGELVTVEDYDIVKVNQDFFTLRKRATGNCFASNDLGNSPEMVDLQVQCVGGGAQFGNQFSIGGKGSASEFSFPVADTSEGGGGEPPTDPPVDPEPPVEPPVDPEPPVEEEEVDPLAIVRAAALTHINGVNDCIVNNRRAYAYVRCAAPLISELLSVYKAEGFGFTDRR